MAAGETAQWSRAQLLLEICTLTLGGTQLPLWTLWTLGMHMHTFIQRYTRIRVHKKTLKIKKFSLKSCLTIF